MSQSVWGLEPPDCVAPQVISETVCCNNNIDDSRGRLEEETGRKCNFLLFVMLLMTQDLIQESSLSAAEG